MDRTLQDRLRTLPSVASLLEHEEVVHWLSEMPRRAVVAALQSAIDAMRQEILSGRNESSASVDEAIGLAEELLAQSTMPSLRRVINATGIVLHTGLGRAPLSEAAIEAIVECASGYCNLEFDLATGERGERGAHVASLLTRLSGAEDALVVNNNAAATLLILQALSSGKETLVSRGQLIEIGGNFRMPDIMAAGGAILREVGTTNRTRISDYRAALGDRSAVLLRVHTSNYRVVGFTQEASLAELVALGREFELPVVDDLGSGALLESSGTPLSAEPTVFESVRVGADVVCFSGDKLMGGPQCGIIVGRATLLEKMRRHPFMRAFRVDKLALLALEATLRAYLDSSDPVEEIPTLRMLLTPTEELSRRAQGLAQELHGAVPREQFFVCSDVSFAGGGSLPAVQLDAVVVQWRPNCAGVEELCARLRTGEHPVVVRIRDGCLFFDVRTIAESDMEPLVAAVSAAVWECGMHESDDRSGISLPVLP